MLRIYDCLVEMDTERLMKIYYGCDLPGYRLREYYDELYAFFSVKGALYAVWQHGEEYLSAVRIEPYKDGVIFAGLETHPDMRRRGFATELLTHVLHHLRQSGVSRVYSHVEKRNYASVRIHEKCGFTQTADHAVFLDGNVSQNYRTYCKILN